MTDFDNIIDGNRFCGSYINDLCAVMRQEPNNRKYMLIYNALSPRCSKDVIPSHEFKQFVEDNNIQFPLSISDKILIALRFT